MTSSPPPSEPSQNLLLCVAIMSLSGLLRVVATMVLAFPDFLSKSRGRPLGSSPQRQRLYSSLFVTSHVLLLGVAAVVSVVGSFFGPVSIAVPVQTGSQLLFNVAAMGVVLRMRAFDKSQRTGTYVVFFSVLSLVDVGPSPQDGQDVADLLSHPDALLWGAFLTAAMVGAAICTVPLLTGAASEHSVYASNAFFTLTVGVTVSNVGMATSGKALGILKGSAFWAALGYYIASSFLGLIFSVVSATSCDQGIFTPLSSVALIIVNMMTGIIIWEDYRVIDTWIGYACACLLMCCGVYLLAEVDLIEGYYRRRAAELVPLGGGGGGEGGGGGRTQDGLTQRTEDIGETSGGTYASDADAWHEALETTRLISTGAP